MPETEKCVWKLDFGWEDWDTGCGKTYYIEEGGPKDNQMRFCCYCGKPLEENRVAEHEDQ